MNFDFEDDEFEDEEFEGIEEKFLFFNKYLKNPSNKDSQKPGIDIIEALVDYSIEHYKFIEALEFCNIWIEYFPEAIEPQIKKAIILHNLLETNQAEIIVDKILEKNPYDYDILLLKASILDSKGKYQESLDILNYFLNENENNLEVLFQKAMLLQNMEKYDDCINILNDLLLTDFSKYDIKFELAFTYNLKTEYEKAINYYTEILEDFPFDANVWYNIGVIHNSMGHYYRSIEFYNYALILEPDNFSAWFNKGNSYSSLGRITQSIESYLEAYRILPTDFDTLYALGVAYNDNNQYVLSIEFFTKALAINPKHYRSLISRAHCWESLENPQLAQKDLKAAFALNNNDPDLLFALAELAYNMNELDKAEYYIDLIIDNNPNNFSIIYEAIISAFDYGLNDKALRLISKFEKTDYFNHDVHYLKSMILASMGQYRRAALSLSKAIKLNNSILEKYVEDFEDIVQDIEKFKQYISEFLPKVSFNRV